jgi:hypothetical protein
MSADSPGPTPARRWSWSRWTTAVAVVFLLHVILIFTFGARKNIQPPAVKHAPSLALVAESPGDWLALNNATLFALPGNSGFAASMWTELPPIPIHQENPTEEPHWLSPSNSLQMAGLVVPFSRFVQTNHFGGIQFDFNMPPEVAAPATATQPPILQSSTLQIQGEIARRQLLTPIHLPSWPDTDVDAPSKVQVLVDAGGNVVSAVLLPPEIMSPENSWEPPLVHNKKAEAWAVQAASALHFAPLPSGVTAGPNTLARLAVGQLVFNWYTVPVTTTNVSN